MKKSYQILILTIILFLGIPGCDCNDFYLVTGTDKVYFFSATNGQRYEEGVIEADTLFFELLFEVSYYTDGWHGSMASADAFSPCDPPLANELVSMTITSDHDFNTIQAGESLNAILFSDAFQVNINGIIPHLGGIQPEYESLVFRFLEKPVESQHILPSVLLIVPAMFLSIPQSN